MDAPRLWQRGFSRRRSTPTTPEMRTSSIVPTDDATPTTSRARAYPELGEGWCRVESRIAALPARKVHWSACFSPFQVECLNEPHHLAQSRSPAPPHRTVRAVPPHTALRCPSSVGFRGCVPFDSSTQAIQSQFLVQECIWPALPISPAPLMFLAEI